MATIKKDKFSFLDNPKRILVGGVVLGVGGFLLYKGGKGLFDALRKKSTENLADDSPDVRQAMALRSAMNPSGVPWMKTFDTTNSKAVLETAGQIKNLDAVSTAYRKLYADDLLKDLQNELNTEDYQKFLTLVSSNPGKTGGAAPATFAGKNQMVVAKAEVILRSSPDASYHGAIYEIGENKNIIRKAKIGEFLGYATGNQSFDVKNNVKFIEVAYLVKKDQLPKAMQPFAGKSFTYWVSSSSSYVDIFPYFKTMFEKYPATKNEVAYKKPLDFYAGVAGLFSRPVITKRETRILDERMQPIFPVSSKILLGEYVLSLDTGQKRFVKFKTVDNTLRWVDASDVIIQN
ncbi:MAG: hypothetical protein U0T82_11860 [Bacteroidales bacterium]